MPELPLISVVTPCLNRKEYVSEAVESVLRQGYPRFEHIVADGGSTDGTLDILRRYPHIKIISEPDRSLYDGLNKAIRAARGDVIAHLNTDDVFPDEVFLEVGNRYAADPDLEVVYGGSAIFKTVDGQRELISEQMDHEELRFSLDNSINRMPSINAKFFHRRVYERLGLYDWTYRIAGDREFMIRAALYDPRAEFLDRIVYLYRHHSGSLTFNDDRVSEKIIREHLRMTTEFLKYPDLTFGQHRRLQRYHTFLALAMVKIELNRKQPRSGLRYAMRGFSEDRCWPIEFMLAGLRKLSGRETRIEQI